MIANGNAKHKSTLREPQALVPYTKAKLSDKKVCRPTVKPITWRLRETAKGANESVMPYPRIFLFFTLYGSVIQDYLNNNEPDADGKHITVEDVLKVLTSDDLADEGSVERYRDYNSDNKGCNPDNPFVIDHETGYVQLERCIIEYILGPFSKDWYKKQSILNHNGRYYDVLEFRRMDCTATKPERYYFDITKGFTAKMKQRLEEK